jgi:hypothetical protein
MPVATWLDAAAEMFPVILGAVIAFATTWWFALRAERERKLSLGYSLFFKASNVANAIYDIERTVREHWSMEDSGFMPHRWMRTKIPTGFDWARRAEFEPDQLALLARAGEFELINDLLEMARGHDLLYSITGEYAKRHELLVQEFRRRSRVEGVEGNRVSSSITSEDVAFLQPDIIVVEDLMSQIEAKSGDVAAFARKVSSALGPAIQKALRDKRYRGTLKFEDPVRSPVEF